MVLYYIVSKATQNFTPLTSFTTFELEDTLIPCSSLAFLQEQGIVTAPVARQQTVTERCCTWLFTTIFMLQLVSVPILSIFLLIRGLIFTQSEHFKPFKWYPPLFMSIALSGVLSSFWQCFFAYNIVVTVRTTIWLTPILTCAVGILLIPFSTSEAARIGALLVLFAIVQSCYGCFINSRRQYTNRMLLVSAGSPPSQTYDIIMPTIFFSIIYSAFLVIGIGGATSTRTGLDILFISIIITSLAWTMQVVKNVQQVVISMIIYENFTSGEEIQVWTAFTDALDNQFGSICVGSTLVPLIVLIRGSIRSFYRIFSGNDEVMYNSTECFSSIANKVITYGNRWGFVHVGVYDKGFVQASGDTWKTFRRTVGLEQLIDSDITSSICFLSAIAVGAISALYTGILTVMIHKDYLLELTLYAFIIGYFVARVAAAWLQACVMGYFVAYSDDPQSNIFDNTIPRQIQRLQRQNERHYARST